MGMLYSASTKGFYDTEIHDEHPDDVVQVSQDQYAALMAGQVQGKGIAPDANGAPVLTDQAPPNLKGYASAKRFLVETSGIVVGGATISTDRASQAMLTGAFNLATVAPAMTFKWKSSDGVFVSLTGAQVTAIATAVGNHVQAAFAAEAEACAGIDAGTITSVEQVDAAFLASNA